MSLGQALVNLATHPADLLIRRWNWKSAVTSAAIRGAIFFAITLPAGRGAATGAAIVEMLFRTATSGVFGALTQALRLAEPPWAAALVTMTLLPALGQLLDFAVHWARQTPRLHHNTIAGIVFTIISALFNLYAQRHGVLIVGENNERTLAQDMRAIPGTIAGFVLLPFRALRDAFKTGR
jgi:hypothetical protein